MGASKCKRCRQPRPGSWRTARSKGRRRRPRDEHSNQDRCLIWALEAVAEDAPHSAGMSVGLANMLWAQCQQTKLKSISQECWIFQSLDGKSRIFQWLTVSHQKMISTVRAWSVGLHDLFLMYMFHHLCCL